MLLLNFEWTNQDEYFKSIMRCVWNGFENDLTPLVLPPFCFYQENI